jgi:glycogen operon protein
VVEFSPDWEVVIDTAGERADSALIKPGDTLGLAAKSLVVLSEHPRVEREVDHSVAASLAAVAAAATPAHAPRAELRT